MTIGRSCCQSFALNAKQSAGMKSDRSFHQRRRVVAQMYFILLTTALTIGAMFAFVGYAPAVGNYMTTGRFPASQEGPHITRGGDAWIGSSRTRTARQSPPHQSAAEPGALLIDVITRVRDGDTIVVGLIPIASPT